MRICINSRFDLELVIREALEDSEDGAEIGELARTIADKLEDYDEENDVEEPETGEVKDDVSRE